MHPPYTAAEQQQAAASCLQQQAPAPPAPHSVLLASVVTAVLHVCGDLQLWLPCDCHTLAQPQHQQYWLMGVHHHHPCACC